MSQTDAVVAALAERGAREIEHPGGALLEHLIRTSEVLRSWDAPSELVLAGLAHAAYGTDGFPVALFSLDERAALVDLIGEQAEAIVYLYSACDRQATLPQVGCVADVCFRDRFTGEVTRLRHEDVRALAEVTVANELDLIHHSEDFAREHGDAIRGLFARWDGVVSAAAHAEFELCPQRRHAVVGGMRLHYLDWGSAGQQDVVFLHGGGLTAHTWDAVCAALRHDYHCVAVDLRGHGDSEWSPTLDYLLDAHTGDLRRLLPELGLVRPVLVGHSLGGHAAIRYAIEHSDELGGLVVVDTSPFVRSGPKLAELKSFMQGVKEFDSFDDALDHALTFRPTRERDSLARTLRHSLRALPGGRWAWKWDPRRFDERYVADHIEEVRALVPAVGNIRCPTLVVRGADGALLAGDAERFCAVLPNGRFVTIDGAGHNVQSDNPAGLIDALEPFLRQQMAEA